MSSPVTSEDLPDYNPSADACTKMEQLFASVGVLKQLLEYLFDSAGNWNDAAMQEIAVNAAPVGTMVIWTGSSLPSDKWLIANGQLVSRTTYSDLFDAIGTVFGQGDGATTYRIPNMTDRFPLGVGGNALGTQGGASTVTLTEADLPAHSHVVPMAQLPTTDTNPGGQTLYGPDQGGFDDADITSEETGGGGAHNNMPPWTAAYFIIRAKP